MVTYKKRIITVICLGVILLLAILLSAFTWNCIYSKNSKEQSIQSKTTQEIVDDIINRMNYRDITQINSNRLIKHYNIDADVIDEFTMYVSSNNESAFEITCFKLKNIDDLPIINSVISEHMDNKAGGFKELNPTQYNLIKSYQTANIENYVFVIVSSDAEAAKKLFLENQFDPDYEKQ